MHNSKSQHIAILAVIIAFNIALSYVIKIPVPATNGFVNLVEAGIFIAALLGGARSGLIVGGMSGLLLDLLAGYPQWMIFSLFIHGAEGLLVGYIGYRKSILPQAIALLIGSLVMVIGYVLAGAILYNWPAGVASIVGNIAQAVMGLIVALILIPVFKRMPQIDLKV
ncbi:MAG: ECF transporter S component [Leuconostoc pseudomesenteroides]|uniref:ECF transporter S component n=1 Tax=Leuconostoc pseudomesenteroides TaxID=33968 RepID=UPI001E4AE3F0|nr:ECF transporter S component [Leuconostoc pseudomesenteroides]MCC7668670.1 ECF transporter S component [Leuconostoc pseudomesenteroides]